MHLELSCLRRDLTHEEVVKSSFIATRHRFDAISVPASFVADTKFIVGDTIMIAGAVDYPDGHENLETRIHSIVTSCRKGARIIDLAINNTYVMDKSWGRLEKDMVGCLTAAKVNNSILRVIIEYTMFEKEQVIDLCKRLHGWGVEYVVTSTGTLLDDTVDNIVMAYEIERHTQLFVIVASPRMDTKQFKAMEKSGIYGVKFHRYQTVENIFGKII